LQQQRHASFNMSAGGSSTSPTSSSAAAQANDDEVDAELDEKMRCVKGQGANDWCSPTRIPALFF
jgi:hypothetical protein